MNTDYNGMKVLTDKLSKFLYEIVIDFDLSSLYPSIILALNLSPQTMIGQITIKSDKGDTEAFMGDYISGDIINFGSKWVDLPNIDDILEIIEKEQNMIA